VKRFAIFLLLLLPACTQYQTHSFEISLKNETAGPISAGLVKNGPPTEDGWIAPHEVAMMAPQLADRKWGWVVAPGESKTFGPHNGKFAPQVHAILRVYAGTPTIDEMISYSRDDPERLDIYLWPGKNAYVIRNQSGKLQYRVADAPR
jgi:hypothetical protein